MYAYQQDHCQWSKQAFDIFKILKFLESDLYDPKRCNNSNVKAENFKSIKFAKKIDFLNLNILRQKPYKHKYYFTKNING